MQSHFPGYFDSDDEVLHACVRDDDIPQLRHLLLGQDYFDINYCHLGFGPPLHFAAWCGNLDAVNLLLAAGAHPLIISHGEKMLTAIGFAALKGHRHIVRRLWACSPPETHAEGPRLDGSRLGCTQTCFVVAATHGHACIVEDMLDWWDGWSQELKNEALMRATRQWMLSVVTVLLKKASFEQSTLHSALEAATSLKSIWFSRWDGPYEGIDFVHQQLLIAALIDAGADRNSSMPVIQSLACNAHFTSALETLLEKGADPNKTDGSGKSALHILAEPAVVSQIASVVDRHLDGQIDVGIDRLKENAIRLLLQHEASVSQPGTAGECPIHWAAYGLDLRLFRTYILASMDHDDLLQVKNRDGETLLHFAAAGCRIDVMEYLLSPGLDVNATSSNGWTPLMCALTPTNRTTARGGTEVKTVAEARRAAYTLLTHGARTSIITDEGWMPLHVLALHCDLDASGKTAKLAKHLISCGGNPEARAPLLSPGDGVVVPALGVPWGRRLPAAMADPSAQRMVIRHDLMPLHWAAERGAVGVIRALLASGVNVSSMDVDGISPARMAAESKFLARQTDLVDTIIRLLVMDAGAGS